MSRQSSLFAEKLKAYRTRAGAHGRLTQEALAERLGVSIEAIGKYERSLSYIRGDLEHRLTERLGWSTEEVQACRQDWDGQSHRRKSVYRSLSVDDVEEVFGSWIEAARAAMTLADAELSASLTSAFNADEDVWGPIITGFPAHGGFIAKDNRLVAHWGLQFLPDEDRDRFRARRFVETDLNPDTLKRPILPGRYFGYCPIVAIARGHEGAAPLMLSSFVTFLEDLLDRDVFVDGIGAAAITAEGKRFCADVGLTKLGPHRDVAGVEMWELPGTGVAQSFFGRRSPRIRAAYLAEFGAGAPA